MPIQDSTSSVVLSPTRELFQRGGGRVLFWSCLSTGLIGLLLFDLYLTSDLLIGQGEVELNASDVAEYERLTPESERFSAREERAIPESHRVRRVQQGLRATAWRMRNRYWGPAVGALAYHIRPLRTNHTALAVLISVAVVASLINGLVLTHIRTYCQRHSIEIATELRERVHEQAMRIGPSNLDSTQESHVSDLFLLETERLREGVFFWNLRLCRHPLTLVFLFAIGLSIHWLLALQCLIPLVAAWFLVEREKQRFEAARRLAEDRARLDVRLLSEGIRHPRLIGGYGMQEFEKRRFHTYLERVRNQFSLLKRSELLSLWIIRLLGVIWVTLLLFLVSSKTLLPRENSHHLDSASALLLLGVFGLMYRYWSELWDLRSSHRQIHEAYERIGRYLSQGPTIGHAAAGKVLRPLMKSIQFESVTYAVPTRGKILDSLELRLPAGDASALISLDPVETRTFACLLPRFIEPQSGRILFDGEDIAWATLDSLRATTLYVDGNDTIFTGTVLDNITCGNDAYTLQEATEAARATRAHDVILKLPLGYDTVLGEHGEQLDAGDGFLVALTRALLRDPALLIIEEPTTVLADASKALLDEAYDRVFRGRTVLVLPSRLSTVRRANRVVLLHRGRVEDVQPYAKLIKSSTLFRHWEYVCFNEFRENV